jgi:PKD repeat protein
MKKGYALLLLLAIGSIPLFSQTKLRLLTRNEVFQVDKGDFSGFSVESKAYDSSTDRFYGILHYEEVPSAEEVKRLENAGVHFDFVLPVRAYLVSIPTTALPLNHSAASFVPMPNSSRYSKMMLEQDYPEWMWVGNGLVELELILFRGPNWEERKDLIRQLGFTEVYEDEVIGRLTLQGPVSSISRLMDLPYIQHIAEAIEEGTPENDQARTSHRVAHLQQVHPTYDGRDVVVGVGDDREIGLHIDFEGRIIIDKSQPGQASDDHGDHVSGTVLGAGNINPFAKGMAPMAELVYYPPTNNGHFQDIDADYDTYGVFIHNSSYRRGCNSGYDSQAAELDQNSVEHRSYLHVFSAGNNGTSPCGGTSGGTAYIPGVAWGNITGGHKMAKNIIATAALTDLDVPASFSSKGPATDGRIKPDISAVGVAVNSTGPNNTYFNSQGTSMSAPGAAGTLAVLYSAYKQTHGNNDPAGGLMKNILLNTADDLGNPGPDFQYGFGRVNAKYGFEVIENNRFMNDTIANGQSNTHTITVPSGLSELKVMVNWVDPPGLVGAMHDLVNNLDMTLTAPDGSSYLPWVLDPTPTLAAVTSPAVRAVDSLNNKEQVTLENPAAGNYTITVNASNIPFGTQEYFITYHFIDDEIEIDFPAGGETIAPFQSEIIRWAAPTGTGNFTIEFSPDNGQTWFNLSTNTSSTTRHFSWGGPPAGMTTDQARIRVSRNGQSGTSERFNILGRPGSISVVSACPDSTKLTWGAVDGATHYELLTLGSRFMDSTLAVVDTNFVMLTNFNPNADIWLTARALRDSTIIGERSNATFKTGGIANCNLQYDLEVSEILQPSRGLQDCQASSIYPKMRITNNGSQLATNFDVTCSFSSGAGNGSQSLSITDSLQPGQSMEIEMPNSWIFASTTYEIIGSIDYPLDDNPFNDTLKSQVLVSFASGIRPFPYTNDLDGFVNCSVALDCGATSCPLPNGFQNLPNGLLEGDDIDWRTNFSTTASSNTGPSNDHTQGNTSGKYIYLEASECFGQEAILTTPCIDLSTAILPQFSMWYHMYGSNMGELHIDVMAGGRIYTDVVPPIIGNQGDNWLPLEVSLTPFIGEIVNMRIRGITGNDFRSDIALDDFEWSEVTAPPVVNFTPQISEGCIGHIQEFIDLSSNNPTAWEWKFFPNTVTFVNGTNANSQNPEVQFNNQAAYDIRLVVTNNFGTDSLQVNAAVTLYAADSVAVSEDFENISGGFPAPKYRIVNPDNDDTWERLISPGPLGQPSNVISVNNFSYDATGEEDWFVSPEIQMPISGNIFLAWDLAYAYYSATFSDGFEIRMSTDCGETFNTVLYSEFGSDLATAGAQTNDWSPTSASDWRRDSISMNAYLGQSIRIALVNINGYGNNLYLDNFRVYEPGLPTPIADITQSDLATCSDSIVTFSVPTPASGVNYNWLFGLGANPFSASGPGPHLVTYSSGGNNNVSLSANNMSGQDVAYSTVDVSLSPFANYIYSQGASSFDYQFNSTSTGDGTLTYAWDFGDGSTSNQQNPTHTFPTTGGTFVVQLTVSSDCGSSSYSQTIDLSGIGLNEKQNTDWVLYPNPTKGELNVRFSSNFEVHQLVLLDLQGRQLKIIDVDSQSEDVRINVESLAKGTYLLQLKSENGSYIKRFQKD